MQPAFKFIFAYCIPFGIVYTVYQCRHSGVNMAKGSVNKVILIGNLGQDPEVRYSQGGNAIANITVATSESWKDQQGQMQERTEWHRCVMYRRLAEIAGEYLKKGAKVYLEGRLQTREWQDQQGQKRYTTEIVVNEMQMLDGRASSGAGGSPSSPRPQNPQNPQHPASGPQNPPASPMQNQGFSNNQAPQQPTPPTGYGGGYGGGSFDDDIPFRGLNSKAYMF